MRILILALLILSSSALNSYAENADKGQNFRSFLNNTSCAQLVNGLANKEHRKEAAVMIAAFITGANYSKGRDSKIDLKGMALLTEQFCRQNPEKPVTTALVLLDKAIDRRDAIDKKSKAQ